MSFRNPRNNEPGFTQIPGELSNLYCSHHRARLTKPMLRAKQCREKKCSYLRKAWLLKNYLPKHKRRKRGRL